MSSPPAILSGLREIAADYDALICDVWGVLHDGHHAHLAAADALQTFRETQGSVILLSNAPRPPAELEKQFAHLRVPPGCFDRIVTSGGATRDELTRRSATGTLRMMHLGPARDRSLFEGLNIQLTDSAHAEIVLCTGLYNDETEGPGDYEELLAGLHTLGLVMLCANPDIVVQRGDRLIYCAGSLARAFDSIGGKVIYYGKPHRPVYDLALAAVGRPVRRALAIGDAVATDMKGANGAGIDALFIADGIHGEDIAAVTPEHMAAFFEQGHVHARAAMRALVW